LLPGLAPCLKVLNNEFEQQGRNRIDQRRRKNAFGRIIAVGIDIKGEQSDIQHQARHGDRRNLALVHTNKIQEISQRESRIEFDKIINDQAYDRGDQTQYQPEPKIVFFEDHNFHVFSSLLLRT
jgi:hypothetical protein